MDQEAASYAGSDARFQRVCEAVDEEMGRRPVPGVVVGVSHRGTVSIKGFGVTSVEHPLPVTADTLYQVGSITKTFTATALMRLVERDKLELDVPLRQYLPELTLRDADVAARVTLRHLLTHTGGWVGDYFDDTGAGDDALARMVHNLGNLPQLVPLGEVYSYNNAGFYVAGRLLEVLTGESYERALKDLVLDPLGLTRACWSADEVITHRYAVGHYAVDRQPRVARPWALPRCLAPVGGLICAMNDLLRYARFHMGDGTTKEGVRLLQPETLAAMHRPRVPASGYQWVGLSWFIQDVNGTRILRHTGGTKGQETMLCVVPESRFAVSVFTNGEEGSVLYERVRRIAFKEYLEMELPEPQPLALPPEKLAPYVGHYEAALDDCDVRLEDGGLVLHVTEKGGFPTPDSPPPPQQPPPMRMAFYREDAVVILDGPSQNALAEFIRRPDGSIAWFRLSSRVHARV